MEIKLHEVYYHDRLKEKVEVILVADDYAIVRKESDDKSVSTHISHLHELLDMTGDEILRREG